MSDTEQVITLDLIAEHGLSETEYRQAQEILGRDPNLTELGIFSVMWSEHCSYKSSKKWLKTLPTEAPWVICGPGENAGVVDIGDGQAAIFKMESHNHPSFIEPYQGAATGVGGILRDVFTMGARPIANLNCLRFGEPANSRTRHLVAGVVAGIGGYGNCIGVPTVGGECTFHESYNGNILVNAMTVGLADRGRIFYSTAAGAGNPVVYVGSKTGRDGIHGATMASAEFDDAAEEKRPTVQVGDPFTEKLLLEACLELMNTDAIIAIQDMGAAGLTSSSFEMAGKGGMGVDLNLDQVPQRETGMTPYEIMLSESQERMLMVLKQGRENEARRIFEKWELDFAVVGHLTETGRMVVTMHGTVAADLPIAPLANASPEYDRLWTMAPAPKDIPVNEVPSPDNVDLKGISGALEKLIACPDLASKRWVWDQYDYLVKGQTVQRPGGDAAVVRIPGSEKALALTTDCTPRYCSAFPRTGGTQAVAETWRNLTAVGAQPLGITDCMNFGSPERPEIMGQFVECIAGMREACLALDYPVVSGNVSFYNETNGVAIQPTPAIGGLGVIESVDAMATIALKSEGNKLVLIGECSGHLGASLYLREIAGISDGSPPPVDLEIERRNGDFVRAQITDRRVVSCHDISDGGLLVAIAEMALASTTPYGAMLGALLHFDTDLPLHAFAFGEDQGRYIVEVDPASTEEILAAAAAANVPARCLGRCSGDALTINGEQTISLSVLQRAHEGWLPNYMAG
jgi:phosphoribosylformylglycinamidine synthase II